MKVNTLERLPLPDNQIDIWLIEPQYIDSKQLKAYHALLSSQELINAQKKRGATAQRDAIITRAFIRSILSHYENLTPQQWRFGKGFNGKPLISNDNIDLEFNISHATNLIVCAITHKHSIGIDVEYIRRKSDTYKLAPRYFSPKEVEDLQALPYEQQAIDFYHYWTLKEAYIKACGDGLAIPLNQFSFTINDNKVAIAFSNRREDSPNNWQHYLFHPTADHKMGLSISVDSKQPLTVTTRTYKPMQKSKLVTLPLN